MGKYSYTITVEADSHEDADGVMAERFGHYEPYDGIRDYSLSWGSLTARPDWLEMLDAVDLRSLEGDTITPADLELDELGLEAVAALWQRVDRARIQINNLSKVVGSALAAALGEGGAFRYGPNVLRYSRPSNEVCIDPDGLIDYMDTQIATGKLSVGHVVNPQYVKRSWMEPAERETFFEKRRDAEPKLQTVPRERAPRYLLSLEHGDALFHQSDGEVRIVHVLDDDPQG